jgi:hypothetical protein
MASKIRMSFKRISVSAAFIFYVFIGLHISPISLSVRGDIFQHELLWFVLVIVCGLIGGIIALRQSGRRSMIRAYIPVNAAGLAVIFYFLFYNFFVLIQNPGYFLRPLSICICALLTGIFSESILKGLMKLVKAFTGKSK